MFEDQLISFQCFTVSSKECVSFLAQKPVMLESRVEVMLTEELIIQRLSHMVLPHPFNQLRAGERHLRLLDAAQHQIPLVLPKDQARRSHGVGELTGEFIFNHKWQLLGFEMVFVLEQQ